MFIEHNEWCTFGHTFKKAEDSEGKSATETHKLEACALGFKQITAQGANCC
jgi:hypothetical protein